MSSKVIDELKKIQIEKRDVLEEYDIECGFYGQVGKVAGISFRDLCRAHDQLVEAKEKGLSCLQAIKGTNTQLKDTGGNDPRYRFFIAQATLALAKSIFPEEAENIAPYIAQTTHSNVFEMAQRGDAGSILKQESVFGVIPQAFKDERLAESAHVFAGVVEAVEESFGMVAPYIPALQGAEDKLKEIHLEQRKLEEEADGVKEDLLKTISGMNPEGAPDPVQQ
ncbi:MAG: hypothetical protein IJD48_02470 [Clostridia bacterium]|nr:hypothetical protein [Clostridia bacterium]